MSKSTIKSFMPPEIANASSPIQQFWLKMISEGQSERWSTMCALQQPPGTKGTDRAFQQGRLDGNWLDGLPGYQAQRMVREAKAAGINISGKYYMSGLADKRGHCDPEAWVGDTSDVKRVAKGRNLEVRGIVNVDSHQVEPVRKDMNPRIAKELAKKEIKKNPGLSMGEAISKVKEKHLPNWKRKRT
jgi:hypothetical protein